MRKNNVNKSIVLAMSVITASALLAGCGQDAGRTRSENSAADTTAVSVEASAGTENRVEGNSQAYVNPPVDENGNATEDTAENIGTEEAVGATELLVSFGDDGDAFTMHLYENDAAQAVAGHVGTADWRLPIYNYDNYEGWEYFQYYDIPGRYEIPSDPQTVTSAKAGEVYYSEPNRIILFYHDAEISEEYTPIGYIDSGEAFTEAVEKNPVLEGWGNKIVRITDGQ